MKLIFVCVLMISVVAKGFCLSECEKGFYGKQCNMNCSAHCLDDMCTDGGNGAEKCTLGCKPGYHGSRCEVPCRKPSDDVTCQKCPEDCEEGFCVLEPSCVSGCIDGYFGYNCTSDKISECFPESEENCTETSYVKLGYYLPIILSSGAGVCVLVFLAIIAYCLMIRLMKRYRQPTTPEFGEVLCLDKKDGYNEPSKCTKASYIHADDDHYVECN